MKYLHKINDHIPNKWQSDAAIKFLLLCFCYFIFYIFEKEIFVIVLITCGKYFQFSSSFNSNKFTNIVMTIVTFFPASAKSSFDSNPEKKIVTEFCFILCQSLWKGFGWWQWEKIRSDSSKLDKFLSFYSEVFFF